MQWCLDVLQTRERFRDVIFVDESCVEMCANGRIAFHQKSSDFEKKCNRIPRPKHSYKVHINLIKMYTVCSFKETMKTVNFHF